VVIQLDKPKAKHRPPNSGGDCTAEPTVGRRLFIASGLAATLAACTTSQTLEPGNADRYAAERFPIRPVNRTMFAQQYQPVRMSMATNEQPGTIIVDTAARHLFHVEDQQIVMRYGVAVGSSGLSWKGAARIGRKAKWPAWYPTDDMHAQTSGLPRRIEPGPANPLGARALYLYIDGRDTLYRIHGTSEPWTIGTEASSGCIRMLNEDIIELYQHVELGSTVIVR